MTAPTLSETRGETGEPCLKLSGRWTLSGLTAISADGWQRLERYGVEAARYVWDCREIEALDSLGALRLWRLWGRRLPERCLLTPAQAHLFERIAELPTHVAPPASAWGGLARLGRAALRFLRHVYQMVVMIGQLVLDVLHVLRHPADLPLKEISANLYRAGVLALPVTALIGFLIGVVLAFLSALQLGRLGADLLIVNVLGLGIIRELAPMLVAILVAGRSGSALTSQLGTMRVTEEIDALAVMGVPLSLRLILPKVVALAVATPLLVVWAAACALAGGMVAARLQLDLPYAVFLATLAKVVPVVNVWIALAKGVCFGAAIALTACHFGRHVKPDTESLAHNTTAAVVTAITLVIVINALFAVALRGIGVPKL